jgi:type IV pilus assembly protein PilX
MGMILLALLTLLGLTALGTSLMEERMAANARDRIRAFQAAEAALRFCESAITPAALFNNANGLYQPATAGSAPRWETVNWNSDSAVLSYPGGIPLVHSQPRCIAEDLGVVVKESLRMGVPAGPAYGYYRITARGLGASDRTVVVLQTTLKLEK